jgi:hypothetical protein
MSHKNDFLTVYINSNKYQSKYRLLYIIANQKLVIKKDARVN